MKNPGWVDLQVNGHNNVDYSDVDLTEESFLRSAEALLDSGTGIFLPTIITNDIARMRRNAAIIRNAVEKHALVDHIPGVHFEGPFISPTPGAVGAHDPKCVLPPTPENIAALLDDNDGFVKIVTLGADTANAAEAISEIKKRGIVVSVGHHMADYAQVRAAADAGAQLLTHLGNGCPNQLDRHVNPVYAGMAEPRLTAMLITDGHHLPGDLVKLFIKVKGVDKVIVTSDASSLTGLPPGEYRTLGNRAVLYPSGKLYNPDKCCLVGSASTISMCMAFLESLEVLSEAELIKVGRSNALQILGK